MEPTFNGVSNHPHSQMLDSLEKNIPEKNTLAYFVQPLVAKKKTLIKTPDRLAGLLCFDAGTS